MGKENTWINSVLWRNANRARNLTWTLIV